eukprot:228146_1
MIDFLFFWLINVICYQFMKDWYGFICGTNFLLQNVFFSEKMRISESGKYILIGLLVNVGMVMLLGKGAAELVSTIILFLPMMIVIWWNNRHITAPSTVSMSENINNTIDRLATGFDGQFVLYIDTYALMLEYLDIKCIFSTVVILSKYHLYFMNNNNNKVIIKR